MSCQVLVHFSAFCKKWSIPLSAEINSHPSETVWKSTSRPKWKKNCFTTERTIRGQNANLQCASEYQNNVKILDFERWTLSRCDSRGNSIALNRNVADYVLCEVDPTTIYFIGQRCALRWTIPNIIVGVGGVNWTLIRSVMPSLCHRNIITVREWDVTTTLVRRFGPFIHGFTRRSGAGGHVPTDRTTRQGDSYGQRKYSRKKSSTSL